MGKFDNVVICSDFDCTLTSNKHDYIIGQALIDTVPKNNITAIEQFVAEGGTFVVVSGRNPDEIASLIPHLPMSQTFIASNGTAIYSNEKGGAVKSYFLPDDFVEVLYYLHENFPDFAFFRVTDNDFTFHHWYSGDDIEAVLSAVKFPAYKVIIQPSAYDERLVPQFHERIVRAVKEKFGRKYKIDMSSAFTLEVCSLGSGKGEAVRDLLPMLGKENATVIGVGDNQNDLSLISLADVGYAVGNACAEAKAVADRITVPSEKGAIEYIVKDLLAKNGEV